MSIEQYLARHAEPEALLADRVRSRYRAAVVVPALGESPTALDGYRAAAASSPGRKLVILVVNASVASAPELRAANGALLADLEASYEPEALGPSAWLTKLPDFDVLVVDRSSPGHELPPRGGVGHARKIGLDLALALHRRGVLSSAWLFSTDADARLPGDYFDVPESTAGASAVIFPFRHVPSGDAVVDRATSIYELMLRYHVLGLGAARSPYAYHSVGSSLAVDATAYALARGVPKRAAGEDFYLLDKLAKIAPVLRLNGDPIEIVSRRSARVPFGTGPRVGRIADAGDSAVAHPEAFRALGAVLAAFDAYALSAAERDVPFDPTALALPAELVEASAATLATLDVPSALRRAARDAGGTNLRRRLHTWFDALKTLRFLHGLRDRGLSDLPYEHALEQAPFTPGAGVGSVEARLRRLSELELALPAQQGPAVPGF